MQLKYVWKVIWRISQSLISPQTYVKHKIVHCGIWNGRLKTVEILIIKSTKCVKRNIELY